MSSKEPFLKGSISTLRGPPGFEFQGMYVAIVLCYKCHMKWTFSPEKTKEEAELNIQKRISEGCPECLENGFSLKEQYFTKKPVKQKVN
jgi:hypothetical protein